jgi:hypothetical protein
MMVEVVDKTKARSGFRALITRDRRDGEIQMRLDDRAVMSRTVIK